MIDILNEVAEAVWEDRRKRMGLLERPVPFLLKSWFEVNTLADNGDTYQQFIRQSHLESVREVLEMNKRVVAKKIAETLEND